MLPAQRGIVGRDNALLPAVVIVALARDQAHGRTGGMIRRALAVASAFFPRRGQNRADVQQKGLS